MLFDELLRSDLLKLPFNQSKLSTFRNYTNSKLEEYLNLLEELDSEGKIPISSINATKINIIRRQTDFVNGLKNSINLYFEGYPEASYTSFKNTIETRMKNYPSLFEIDQYDNYDDFYRIRVINDNNHLTHESFFHIPFEQRGKVTSQRFSIPGFPSLYLGRTIYICWEELNRPNINEFHSVRLKLTSPIKYIDLAPPFYEKNLYQAKYYKYLMSWPLIFLCSIRVKNVKDIFKPEYIIPQLLLQWIRQNKEIDGIRYWSTHVNQNPINFKGEYYNVVLPVKENKERGLCNSLKEKFEITENVSWQLLEFMLGGAEREEAREEDAILNSKMDYLELIKDIQYPYSSSAFGKIEKHLFYLATKKLKPKSRTFSLK